jgi:hypothetical protein
MLQIPTPMASDPPTSQALRAWPRATVRLLARSNAAYDAATAMKMERATSGQS